jgi:hypothetical protein
MSANTVENAKELFADYVEIFWLQFLPGHSSHFQQISNFF